MPKGRRPLVSSTKSLTGHGLSLAGAMEAGFCCLTLKEGFVPVSAHITELDPVCEGVPVITQPVECAPTDRDEQFQRVRRHERVGGAAEVGGNLREDAETRRFAEEAEMEKSVPHLLSLSASLLVSASSR